MQDYDSQLNDFLLWLDEIETPIETLLRDSSNQASLEDRDQVRMWANHHRVSEWERWRVRILVVVM